MMQSAIWIGILICCLRVASSHTFASWYTNQGPQVIYQNASSGKLFYSIDTGSSSGTGGFTTWAELLVTITPKTGTALAGTGYLGDDGNVYGQVYYISDSGAIIQATIQCVIPGSICELQSISVISDNIATGLSMSSGLAATGRTLNDGYRVFYHDNVGATRGIHYSSASNITWGAGTLCINDTSAIHSATTTDGGTSLTVYGLDQSGNILPSTLQSSGQWLELSSISLSNLTSWDPTNVTILSAVSPTSIISKSIFYIGTDSCLHHITTSDNWETYTTATSQNTSIWPLADEPNASFTLTNNTAGTAISIFYMSGGELVQISFVNGEWQIAVPIFKTMPNFASSTGPNRAVRLGVGIGIGLGLPLVAAIGAAGYLLLRKGKPWRRDLADVREMEADNKPWPLAVPELQQEIREIADGSVLEISRHEFDQNRETQYELLGDLPHNELSDNL